MATASRAHERRDRRRHRPQARRGAPGCCWPARSTIAPRTRWRSCSRCCGSPGPRPPRTSSRPSRAHPCAGGDAQSPVVDALAGRQSAPDRRRGDGALSRRPPRARDDRGPAAMLLPATAQAVALALHELATNAAKYGALSTDNGKLTRHLVDRPRRARGRMGGDRRTAGSAAVVAGLRPLDRALQHRGAVPRRRAAATGGRRACVAGCSSRARRSQSGAASPKGRARGQSSRQRPRAQPGRQAAADGRGRVPGRHDGQRSCSKVAAPPSLGPYARLADGIAAATERALRRCLARLQSRRRAGRAARRLT